MTHKTGDITEHINKNNETITNQQLLTRAKVLDNWNESLARKKATAEGVKLTEDHLQVVQLLRHYYLKFGEVQSGRKLDNMLATAFEYKGGRRYLHKLFPQGPVAQGMRFAGLPVPAHTEDSGFGTAR